jgi:hypothetical protein
MSTVTLGGLMAAPASAAPKPQAVQVAGTWSLTWDWGDGAKGTAPITFVSKGHTFSVTGESGIWTTSGESLKFVYTSANSCHGTWVGRYAKKSNKFSGRMSKNTKYCPADSGTWSMVRAKATSQTALTLSSAKVTYGDEHVEHLSVTVSPTSGSSRPAGKVTVKVATTKLCVIKLKAARGSCRLSRKRLPAGTYSLVATYGGSTAFDASASAHEGLKVSQATSKTALKLSVAKVTVGDEQRAQFSVTVSPEFAGSVASGSVTVKSSTKRLCVIKLSAGQGSCRLSSRRLRSGTYSVVARYGGNKNLKPSMSTAATLTVVKAGKLRTTSRT